MKCKVDYRGWRYCMKLGQVFFNLPADWKFAISTVFSILSKINFKLKDCKTHVYIPLSCTKQEKRIITLTIVPLPPVFWNSDLTRSYSGFPGCNCCSWHSCPPPNFTCVQLAGRFTPGPTYQQTNVRVMNFNQYHKYF